MADQNNDLINIQGTKKSEDEVKIKLKDLPKEVPNYGSMNKNKDIKPVKSKDASDQPANDSGIIGNWTDTNVNTLRTWKGSMRQALYIYNHVLEKLKRKLNHYNIIILVLGILTTLISAISTYALVNTTTTINNISANTTALTNTDSTNVNVGLVISVINLVMGAVITILKGLIKLFGLDDLVSSYTLYLERLDQLYSTIANQLTLPPKLRNDALDFIKAENEIYLKLIKESPEVASSDYNLALEEYRKYLQDESANMKFASAYNNNDNIIEIV